MQILSVLSCALLLFNGSMLSIRSRFFQIRSFRTIFDVTFKNLFRSKDKSGFKAMSIALGSTIGIGNIIGVSAAVIIGGPGSILWMLFAGVFGMIIKFFEIYISVKDAKMRKSASGGPMYVFKSNFGKYGFLGSLFAIICIFSSLFAGNLIQSRSIYRFSVIGFNISPWAVTIVILPLIFFILLGKDKLYQNLCAIFVPLMAITYILACLAIIIKNYFNIPNAFYMIISGAFGIDSCAGGFTGALLSASIRQGITKGLFTNEAGMGSSPIAHSSAKTSDPFSQGCWGIVEVFIDTIIVCSLTAFAILCSPIYQNRSINDPFHLITLVFSECFGSMGMKFLCMSSIAFAFASIIGWSFYGLKALEFLSKNTIFKASYILIFLLFIPFSLKISELTIWYLTDTFNSLMLILNSVIIMLLSDKFVKCLSKNDILNLKKI